MENRTGAGTNIAAKSVAHAAPDGYTLLWVTQTNAINTTLYSTLNFSFDSDIQPVASILHVPAVVMVNPSVPAKTIPEFIAYAKANPGKVNMSSPGIGSINHVAGEMFKMMAGVDLVHVPYRSSQFPDLLGGQVQVTFNPLPSSLDFIRSGKLRGLAVTSATRSDALPDIPTVGDFLPGYEATAWFGIGAPKNTSAEIVETLNKAINAGLADPQFKASPDRSRGCADAHDVRRVWQVHRQRDREVGQGDQICECQAGVIGPADIPQLPLEARVTSQADRGGLRRRQGCAARIAIPATRMPAIMPKNIASKNEIDRRNCRRIHGSWRAGC